MTGLIAILQALPEMFKLLNYLGTVVDRFMKWSHDNNLEKWISDLEKSVDDLEKADSPEKKLSAAQGIVGVIKNL